MEQWELVAREQIRETLHRYNYYGDRGQLHELAAQFTEDGVFEIRGREAVCGRAEIVRLLSPNSTPTFDRGAPRTQWPLVRHHLSNILFLGITPERATVVSYFLRLHRDWPNHWGIYRDVLVPAEGRWLFARRHVSIDGEMRPPRE
jgi:hypothetical protein